MSSPAPAKSQPLHNFSLSLKWSKNQTNNSHLRGRKFGESSSQRSPPPLNASTSQLPPVEAAPPRKSSPLNTSTRHFPLMEAAPPRKSPQHNSAAGRFPHLEAAPPRKRLFSDSALGKSPMPDFASKSDSGYAAFLSENRKAPTPESAKKAFASSSSNCMIEKSEKKWTVTDVSISGGKEVKSKTYIRLRVKKKAEPELDPEVILEEGNKDSWEDEGEEFVPKTWNLRPRKPPPKRSNANPGPSLVVEALEDGEAPLPLVTEAKAADKKKKKRKNSSFSISLSREEIEEDLYAMTGSKPSRRPKKRPKTVQKQLDNSFPGMWLGSITPEVYKVSEPTLKG